MIKEDKIFDKLNTALDVAPAPSQNLPVAAHTLTPDEQNAQEDYEYTKEKLKSIIDQSESVLEHAADIAKETGEARSIEVFSHLAKTMGDLARGVMGNTRDKAAVDKDRGVIKNPMLQIPSKGGSLTQNNQTIFVGTTKELSEMLRKQDEENNVIEVEPTTDSTKEQ